MAFSFYTRKKEPSVFGITDWSQYQSKPQTASPLKTAISNAQQSWSSKPKTTTPVRTTQQLAADRAANQAYSQRPDIQAMVKAKQQPKPEPKPEQPSGYESILARMKALADSRISQEQTGGADQMAKLEALEAERQGKRSKQIETLEGLKQRAIDRIKAGIPEQEQLTAEQKASIEDVYGQEERSDLRRRDESAANLQKTFANLGSIDSSVFQQAAERQAQAGVEASSARGRAKTMDLAQADRDLVAIKRKAEEDVDNEVFNFENALMQIEDTYGQGTQDYYNAVNNLMQTTSDRIYALQQGVLDAEMGVENLKAESMASGSGADLTEKQRAFVSAGEIARNALTGLESGNVASGIGQGFIGNLGEKLGWNTPQQQSYRSDIAAARTAVRNALLGANMSPKEMESLMAAIPEYNDDPEIAKQKLRSFIQNTKVMANPTGNSQSFSMPNMVSVISPEGEVGQIDASELRDAVANGWRQV